MRTVFVLLMLVSGPLILEAASAQTPTSPPAASATPAAPVPAASPPARAYGWQLMTADERAAYRAKMRSLQTDAEREAFRAEHHKQMVARAKERGVTLPEDPPARRGARAGAGRGGCCQGTPPDPAK
ncbi:MAG: hypothetical protein JSR54_00980 [Proteobacteria bacterium]|nr:hypothetical protein [Pseudomonadota bacterium]